MQPTTLSEAGIPPLRPPLRPPPVAPAAPTVYNSVWVENAFTTAIQAETTRSDDAALFARSKRRRTHCAAEPNHTRVRIVATRPSAPAESAVAWRPTFSQQPPTLITYSPYKIYGGYCMSVDTSRCPSQPKFCSHLCPMHIPGIVSSAHCHSAVRNREEHTVCIARQMRFVPTRASSLVLARAPNN